MPVVENPPRQGIQTADGATLRFCFSRHGLIGRLGIWLRPEQQLKSRFSLFSPAIHLHSKLCFLFVIQRSIFAPFDSDNVSASASSRGAGNGRGNSHVIVVASTQATRISPSSEVVQRRCLRHLCALSSQTETLCLNLVSQLILQFRFGNPDNVSNFGR
jgi:hypothetical protein